MDEAGGRESGDSAGGSHLASELAVEAASRRRPILLAHALLFALCAAGLPRLTVDNSPRAFFVEDAAELERYARFQHLFGRDQLLRVVIEGEALWTAEGLGWLDRLETDLAGLRGVLGVGGLGVHYRWVLPRWPPDDPVALRARATADPLDLEAGWTTPDGELASVLLILYDLPADRLRQTVREARALIAEPPPGIEARVLGLPVVSAELDRAVTDVGVRTLPLLILVSAALLRIALGSLRAAAAPLLYVSFVLAVVFGAMGWSGVRLDLVLSVLAPLLLVIALATAAYLLVEHRHRLRLAGKSADPLRALRATYRERGWAVLWTGVTTCAGFGSLVFGAMPPVRALGQWAALGIALLTFEAFVLYPALLATFGGGTGAGAAGSRFERSGRALGRRLAELAVRRRPAVLALGTVVALAAGAGLVRLPVGQSVLDYLRPDHPVRAGLERLEARGIAVVAGELVIDGSAPPLPGADSGSPPPDFGRPDDLQRLRGLAADLRAEPGVFGTLSAIDLLDAAVRAEPTPPPRGPPLVSALATLRSNRELEPLLAATLTRDDRAARISLLVPMTAPAALEPLFERAVELARARFPGARVWLTGAFPLVVRSQSAILRTMGISLALTLTVVAAVLAALVRSSRSLAAALVPNLLPVLFVLGLMGWLAVPLDGTTVMIAAVVLGLAVDDTLHALGAFRRRAPRLGARRGAVAALEHVCPGHLLSTATLVAGFLACGLSSFAPVARFGRLTAVALLVALLSDLLLLPALLAGLGRRQLSALSAGSPPSDPGAAGPPNRSP